MTPPPFPPGSTVVAYLRDSGGPDQDLSIDQQESAAYRWCAENQITLTRIYRDTRSGKDTVGRDGFEALVKYFFTRPRPKEAGLIIWRFNRFARDIDDASYFKSAIRRIGYEIYALQDSVPQGHIGRLVEFMYDWTGHKYLLDMSEDIKRAQRDNVLKYGSLGGFPPRGYKQSPPITIGSHRDGSPHIVHRWIPDPDVWQTCRLAWQMRAAGASYREIHAATHLFSTINSYSAFYRNRLYLGELRFSGETYPNYVEPLIDQATWDAVQIVNGRNRRRTDPSQKENHLARLKSSFLLSGLVHCKSCGALMNGETVKKKNEKTASRNYYTCSGRRAKWNCTAKPIPRDSLEQTVIERVTGHILSPTILEKMQQDLIHDRQATTETTRTRRAELAQNLAALKHRITNLVNAIADAGHTPTLLAKLRDLEQDQAQIEQQIHDHDIAIKTEPVLFTLERLERFSKNLATLLTHADQDTRRRILQAIIKEIHILRDGHTCRIRIQYYLPPSDLIDSLANLPLDDYTLLTDSSPPNRMYAYAISPSGGTPRNHTIYTLEFTFEILRKPYTKAPA